FLRVLTARHLGLGAAEGRLFQLRTGTVSRLSTEHDWPVIAEWNAVGTSGTPHRALSPSR
ncbi:hypothetical protein ACWEQ2_44910, partial [Streptomyces sp. NPDC004096]